MRALYPGFDQALSLHLDALIIALDQRPPWPQRTALRIQKAWLETRVPATTKGGA